MKLFTANQVNHVYVANSFTTSTYNPTKGDGAVFGGTTPDGKSIYFKHSGKGGITRTDLIDLDKIMYYKVTIADSMKKELMEYKLKLSAAAKDSSNSSYVKAGYDFFIRIKVINYIGISPEDAEYWKYGLVHTSASMSINDFWIAMAKSILRNMSREATPFLKLYPITHPSTADVVGDTEITLANVGSLSGTIGIAIREVEPNWILGLKQQKVLKLEVVPVPFEDKDGETIYWADGQSADTAISETGSGVYVNNSKDTADYEYFWHGERGDQYRMMGWPDYIPTEYMVNAANANGYDYVQIHYSYIGSNESVQKSEKDLTFLVPRLGSESNAATAATVATNIESFIKNALNALGADAANAAITAALGENGAIATAIAGS